MEHIKSFFTYIKEELSDKTVSDTYHELLRYGFQKRATNIIQAPIKRYIDEVLKDVYIMKKGDITYYCKDGNDDIELILKDTIRELIGDYENFWYYFDIELNLQFRNVQKEATPLLEEKLNIEIKYFDFYTKDWLNEDKRLLKNKPELFTRIDINL